MSEENIPKQKEAVLNSSTPSSQPITQNNITPQPASQLSRRKKIILGIATFWPIFYIGMFVFFIVMVGVTMAMTWGFRPLTGFLLPLITLLLTLLAHEMVFYPTLILILALALLYPVIVLKNKSISKKKKALWMAVFFQGIFGAVLLLAMKTTGNDILMNFVIYLGVFIITPYIAMPMYWHGYIWKETQPNQVPENRFPHPYIFIILYLLVFLIIPFILFGPDTYMEYLKAEDLKKRQLIAFENTQNINAYLPTAFEGEWKPQLNSGRGIVKFKYSRSSGYNYKEMAEIKSPKTNLGCDHKTYLELGETVPEYRPVSEKLWLGKCEELLISGKKSVLSENEWIIKNQGSTFNAREYLMVFDKESTRIFLHSRNTFLESETPSPSETKSNLIGVAENLRPVKITSGDFKP